jgi:RNA polymerase sigma-70 factor (ECF subfamily)
MSSDRVESPVVDDQRWFAEEVHAHDAALKSYLRGAFPAVRDVDDVTQESYLRVWRARGREPIRIAKAFLFRVARNVALNLLARERVSPINVVADLAALPVIEGGPDAAEVACTREEILLLADGIESLPARCREIFILRRLQGIPQKEIAARFGISEQTVQVQVQRGVKRCAAFLRRCGVNERHLRAR